MNLQTEIYISVNGENYFKVDLSKSESINMRHVYKDTTDLSKIFSPFSLSFTFPGTLHNQRIFGFVGNTKIFRTKKDTIFDCKIYSNGILAQAGKLKLTEIREENGSVKSFTANFTTSMLSLASRMGNDLINDLPEVPVTMDWTPNRVFDGLQTIGSVPSIAFNPKYFVPLISNNRVFQVRPIVDVVNTLDNVQYRSTSDPLGENVLKSSELFPAIQGRSVIDFMKKKYGLKIEMPLENTAEYNDWYIWCNSEKSTGGDYVDFDLTVPFGDCIEYNARRPDRIPDQRKYLISGDLFTNKMTIVNAGGGGFSTYVNIVAEFKNVVSTKGNEGISIDFLIELSNGAVFEQKSASLEGGNIRIEFTVKDQDFVNGNFIFKLKSNPKTPIVWASSNIGIYYSYFDNNAGGGSTADASADYKQESLTNYNSVSMKSSVIDLYKAIPEMKCVDFLMSFIKIFNISIFNSDPNSQKLYWLTPKDLLTPNKKYTKKVVDYTPYMVSRSVMKSIASDYNYYNFKHKKSKYKSNIDYLAARGVEFGQTVYPAEKPTQDLQEFKVETNFCILESVPIAGMTDEFTSYGFTDEAPEVLVTGEKRYKSNTDDLTIFFQCGYKPLIANKSIGFQTTSTIDNVPTTSELTGYIKTSPVHPNGFSFGFSLIQESVQRSLYFDFYKAQTERLLNPNCLKQKYKLELPATEITVGFKLQNEIILQEERFSLIDAQIDITTGNATMSLLNF